MYSGKKNEQSMSLPHNSGLDDAYNGKLFPDARSALFRNMHELFPSRAISRGSSVTNALKSASADFSDMLIKTEQGQYDIYDYVSANRISSLLILHEGKIKLEYYEQGNSGYAHWMSMSVAKSITSVLVGAAITDGYISSLLDPVTDYLPTLGGSAYEGVSVRNLLQMKSGIRWNEEYADPNSERRQLMELQRKEKLLGALDFMAGLERVAEPGTCWNYNTGDTYLLGKLLYAATGEYLSDYFARRIWSKLGMQADAYWLVDSAEKLEMAGTGFCATARDYARFGQFVMRGGTLDGEQLIPEGWFSDTCCSADSETPDYGYLWWVIDPPKSALFKGGISGIGIFGQYLYINPSEDIVVFLGSSRSKALDAEHIPDNDFFNAVVNKLRQ